MRSLSRAVVVVALSVITIVGSVTTTASAAPAVAPATVLGSISDGPGSFSVYRTVDSGKQAAAVDDDACNAYFGFPRRFTVLQRLDARLYTFANSATTGFLTDPTRSDVGPIYVCGTLGLDGQSIYEQYSRATAPGIGPLTMSGPCGLTPYIAEGRGGADCVQRINPNANGVTGGVASSNSVTNPIRLPGGTTGSLWTFYTTGTPRAPVNAPTAPQAPDTGSVKYSVGREVDSISAGTKAGCPGGVRTTKIHAISVDAATGAIAGEPSATTAADATICYQKVGLPDFVATLTISIRGIALTTTNGGHCRQSALPGTASRQQTCGFALPANYGRGLTGGLVTLNGVVPPNDPAGSVNSAVWTISVLGSIKPAF
ncbi:MAG: hypothetical protein NTW76_12815 [Corynebacteriales bacterium]|nr:hypothetical protein [Mycobacteriales bacterium]